MGGGGKKHNVPEPPGAIMMGKPVMINEGARMGLYPKKLPGKNSNSRGIISPVHDRKNRSIPCSSPVCSL
jgi:hypothetical protein